MNRRTRIALQIVLGIVFALSVLCVAVFLLFKRNACTNEVLQITETSGIRFIIERDSCDVLAKEEYVSVYATRLPVPKWKLWNPSKQQSLLFRYDPGSEDKPLPSITLPTQEDIHIAVPSISSVVFQQHEWNGKSVSYDIGRTDFPNVSK